MKTAKDFASDAFQGGSLNLLDAEAVGVSLADIINEFEKLELAAKNRRPVNPILP